MVADRDSAEATIRLDQAEEESEELLELGRRKRAVEARRFKTEGRSR